MVSAGVSAVVSTKNAVKLVECQTVLSWVSSDHSLRTVHSGLCTSGGPRLISGQTKSYSCVLLGGWGLIVTF